MLMNTYRSIKWLSISALGFVFTVSTVLFQMNCKKSEIDSGFHTPLDNPHNGPAAGNPDGNYTVPPEAGLEDVSNPDHIIGTGTPESVTVEDFRDAVSKGGKIVFNSGGKPVTLTLKQPAIIFNNTVPDIVIDGGGLIALSGGGTSRILYMNTCDQNLVWTTSHCDNQDHPRLTVQNLIFSDGNSTTETEYDGGGAIWVRGGKFKAVNCRFFK